MYKEVHGRLLKNSETLAEMRFENRDLSEQMAFTPFTSSTNEETIQSMSLSNGTYDILSYGEINLSADVERIMRVRADITSRLREVTLPTKF